MIPEFDLHGVLPPFVGQTPTLPAARAPYACTLNQIIERLGTSDRRRQILAGFIEYRQALRGLGVHNAVQWCDGSFVEDKEPNDIDVITWAPLGAMAKEEKERLLAENLWIVDPRECKKRFKVDGYFIDTSVLDPQALIERATYWYGLFTHQRQTLRWKGILKVQLRDAMDDNVAKLMLAQAGEE